jgi:hypothetical protein
MKPTTPQSPFLLVIDPTPTFSTILKAVLRREGYEVEIVAFQQPGMAIFWLSGEMDRRKAAKRPLASPWDEYPALKPPTVAIISLAFPTQVCNRMLALLLLQEPRAHLFTTSTMEELAASQSQEYWRHVVSHIPRPLKVDDVIERLIPFLQQ